MQSWRKRIALALVGLTVVACGGPASTPTPSAPTALPASTGTTAPSGQTTTSATTIPAGTTAQTNEVEDAFLTNVDDLIAESADLAVTPCDELTTGLQANPNLVPSIRGFATALKRIGTSQAVLDTAAVRASLADLDHSMSELEGALSLCGIKVP